MAITKVLVAEDDRVQRMHLEHILSEAGYIVSTATDGVDAVAKARSEHPDAILMDVNMPRLDGFAAARSLKNDARTRHIPVVFVTVKDQKADRVWARMQGAEGYVTKPYAPEDVLDQLLRLARL